MASDRAEAIVVCGVPASGKTTFARDLARKLRWPLLDLDTLTNPLFEYAGGEFLVDVPSAHPTERASVNDIRYTCLLTRPGEPGPRDQCDHGGPFTSERTFPAAWARLMERLGLPDHHVHLTWLDTPPTEVVQRMQHRGAARDLEKAKEPHRFLTPDVTAPPGVEHTRVNGLLTPGAQLAEFLSKFSPHSVLVS